MVAEEEDSELEILLDDDPKVDDAVLLDGVEEVSRLGILLEDELEVDDVVLMD